MSAAPKPVQSAIDEIRALVGDRLTISKAVRDQHGRDESYHEGFPPDAVVYPRSVDEIVAMVKICARHKAPIIPYGTGTSLEGHVCALKGGVCIDVTEMNRILRVSTDDLDVTVEPGVTRKQLNEHLKDTGLFFPIDPGANASLGGMTATRASGTNAVRYGTMRENVLGLTVVTADGRIVRTSRRARKSAAGYDLTRLFVGSEGTLGVIVDVTLRLYGIPEAISAATCSFTSVDGAVNTVIQTIQAGVPIARIEFLDDAQVKAINAYAKMNHPELSTLFLEFHGTKRGVEEQAEMVQSLASDNGGGNFLWTTKPEERTRLWEARHNAAYANKALRANCGIWATDVCVPISRLAECIVETKNELSKSFLPAPIVGHVGDGNFHVTIVFDPKEPKEVAEVHRLNDRLVQRALAMDGTCTGEHGIGYGKMDFLVAEHGEGVALMRQIKKAFDPDNIMNPGKILKV